MNHILYFSISVVPNNVFFCKCVFLNLTSLLKEMKLPPLAKAVKFDAGTSSNAFFDKVAFVGTMDALLI